MTDKSFVSDALSAYIDSVAAPEHPVLARLRAETGEHPEQQMQITAQQGHLLQLLVKAIGARRTLEIGVFTGYSSLAVALALPKDGRITALDVSEEYTNVARRYWLEARVDHKIDLRIGPASVSLDALVRQTPPSELYDFAFIDADKPSYPVYFEKCLALLRPSGLLAFDNTLQHGRVADPASREPNTISMRAFNLLLQSDPRIFATLLPVADGLTLAIKL